MFRRVTLFTARTAARRSIKSMATGLMWTSSKVGPAAGSRFDQKAVTYTGNSASVANSGKVFDPAEENDGKLRVLPMFR